MNVDGITAEAALEIYLDALESRSEVRFKLDQAKKEEIEEQMCLENEEADRVFSKLVQFVRGLQARDKGREGTYTFRQNAVVMPAGLSRGMDGARDTYWMCRGYAAGLDVGKWHAVSPGIRWRGHLMQTVNYAADADGVERIIKWISDRVVDLGWLKGDGT